MLQSLLPCPFAAQEPLLPLVIYHKLSRVVLLSLDAPSFAQADLSEHDLSDANLQRTNLHGSDLSHSSLDYADLSHSNLSHACLFRTFLSSADLAGARLPYADQQPPALGYFGSTRPHRDRGALTPKQIANS